MHCASPQEASPFLKGDGEGVGGKEDIWERRENKKRGGKRKCLVYKINEKMLFKNYI